jgi:anionic cell wall polymer biosynthesis LytR-Cps2A-Psr (LCP) family protein
MFGQVVEATVTLVLLYLVVANADGFSKAAQAVGGVYVNAVTALQGRQSAGTQ